MKVAICTPTIKRPYKEYLESLEASIPLLDKAGIEHSTVFEVGCPYISGARCTMLGKALKWAADQIVFIDHDLSWDPEDLLKLIQTEGDVVSGTYRFKKDEVQYMGTFYTDDSHRPITREDGCIKANRIPAGFMKVTRNTVNRFLKEYPDLRVGVEGNVDLFNHGAIDGIWYGEDYAFSLRWERIYGDIWLIPDLNITHHSDKEFKGNLHHYLMEQPGGSEFRG